MDEQVTLADSLKGLEQVLLAPPKAKAAGKS